MSYRSLYAPILLLLCLFMAAPVFAQTGSTQLGVGEPVVREISAGESHAFSVNMNTDQFLMAVVDQRGIDVTITAYDPSGKRLEEFDSPNGTVGPEPISLFSEFSGEYRLEVRPFDDEQEAGRYEIRVERLEAAATTPSGKIDQLFATWDRPGSPGAAVAVIQDGEIVFKKGYGEANLEYGVSIDPGSVFYLASVSKQFVAFAILLLEQQGKLSLDDDIREYVPELPDYGQPITIRHLVHHTSGIRDYLGLMNLANIDIGQYHDNDGVVRLIARQQNLNFEPGAEFLYSNSGYFLLAVIVERASGQTLREYAEAELFGPLGMNNTHFHDDYRHIIRGRAFSYFEGTGGYLAFLSTFDRVGSGGTFSTVEDLYLWDQNFYDAKVGGPDLIEKMHTPGVLNDGEEIDYAFGISVGEYRGLQEVAHSGGLGGYRTFLTRFPNHRLTIIVLANLGSIGVGGLTHDIAELYLADVLDAQAAEPAAATPADDRVAAEVDPAIYAEYTGDYELQPGFVLTVSTEEDRLLAQATGQSRFEIYPVTETMYSVREFDAQIEFRRDDAGAVSELVLYQNGREMTAPRIEITPFDLDQLPSYAGAYYSVELDVTYTVTHENGALVLEVAGDPRGDIEMIEADLGRGSVGTLSFERDDLGEIVGFSLDAGRVRGLTFDRI